MKILQAIVASAVETLDGRQGFGLVCCSHALPKELRQEASDIGYSRDAGGLPIYSLKTIEAAGVLWILMNRTVPAVDFTGRASYLSHSLALEESSFNNFFQDGSSIASVFEFMRHYAWLSSWDAPPKFLDHSEDIDVTALREGCSGTGKEGEVLNPSLLLAFDYSEDPPKPRRAVWQLEGMNPDNMLELFHQVWFCIDPWCGTKKYSSYLPEPTLSMRDSWKCSFTTNLGNRQSDAYRWVVASPSCESIPNRAIINSTHWQGETPESIKEKIGLDHGTLLVERCIQSPKVWAEKALRAKLVQMHFEFAERMKQSDSTLYAEANGVIDSIKSEIKNDREIVSWGEQKRWWSFNNQQDLDQWHKSLIDLEQKACYMNETEFHNIQKEINPIQLLLGEKEEIQGDRQCSDNPIFFANEFERFTDLAKEFKEQKKIVLLLTIANQFDQEKSSLQVNLANLNEQLKTTELEKSKIQKSFTDEQNSNKQKIQEIATLRNENSALKQKAFLNNANAQKRIKWQSGKGIAIIISIAVAVLLLTYFAIHYLTRPGNTVGQSPEETNKTALNEPDKSASIISNLETEIKRHESTIGSLKAEIIGLKKVESFDKPPMPDDKKPKEEKAGGDLKTTDNKKPKEVEQGKDTKPVDDNQNIQAKPLTPSNTIEVKPVLPAPSNPNAEANTKPPIPDVQKTPVEQREKPAPEAETPDQKQ